MNSSWVAFYKRFRSVLAILVQSTATKVDDAALDMLDAVADDETIGRWFAAKVEAEAAGTLNLEGEPPQELRAALARRKIDWPKWIAAVPSLIAIFKAFAG